MAEASEAAPAEDWAQQMREHLERVQATLPELLNSLDVERPDRSAVTAAALDLLATAHSEIALAAQRAGLRPAGEPLLRLDEPIGVLGLSNRPYNVLARHNVRTIGDLVTLSEPDLAAMQRMEPANVAEITRALAHHNLALAR